MRAILLAAACLAAGTALAMALSPAQQIIMFGGNSSASGSGGGGGNPCTNQLVLDYSNSCALIAQGWGQ